MFWQVLSCLLLHHDVFLLQLELSNRIAEFVDQHVLYFASHFQIPQVRLWMKPDFKLLEKTQQELIDIQDQDYPVTYCEACIEKKILFNHLLIVENRNLSINENYWNFRLPWSK